MKYQLKKGFNIINSKLEFKIPNEKIDTNIKFKISSKKGGVEYKIPKESNEIDISIQETSPLPNFHQFSKIDNTLLVGGTSVLGGLGTIGYISLQGYSADARNSKRSINIGSILLKMRIEHIKGVSLFSFVNIDKQYAGKDIYVGGTKLVLGENYFVGTPNYSNLGMNKIDYLDPDGDEYLIGVTTENRGIYQVFSKIESSNNSYYNKIRGNYSPNNTEKISIEKKSINKVTIKGYENLNKIRKGNNTNLGIVQRISSNLMDLTLDKEVEDGVNNIYILKNGYYQPTLKKPLQIEVAFLEFWK